MKSNILITSAGKRVELLEEFKRELKKINPEGLVLAVDLNPKMSPACRIADNAFPVHRVTSPEYINELLEICISNDVKLVIPTIDTELAVLAENRHKFSAHNIDVMVSDAWFIATCRDKRKTMGFFERVGIRNPETRDKNRPIFPMFAKPYDGSLSTNIHIIKRPEDLTEEVLSDPKLIFMELIDKNEYKEYTVDMYFDANGEVKSIVPRERIEIRSGEVNKGAARKNYLLSYLKERMGMIHGIRGCICIQLFYREADNDVVGIEINPRYGGGYPLSYYAKANFPKMMIEEYIESKPIEYSENWIDNTVMLRYDSQVIFYE